MFRRTDPEGYKGRIAPDEARISGIWPVSAGKQW
jgi:hypothetical protein